MSSEIDGLAVLAPIVILPAAAVAATLGAGFLAWQAGKLTIAAGMAVNEAARQNEIAHREAEKQKKTTALANHQQLIALCQGLLSKLDGTQGGDPARRSALRSELKQIINTPVPEDPLQLAGITAVGLLALDRLTAQQETLLQTAIAHSGDYAGYVAADMMDDLRLAVAAARMEETKGTNVAAADPRVLERAGLNKRLEDLNVRFMTALEFVLDMDREVGLSNANHAWFQSCFNGVDQQITRLCSPRVSNKEMKRQLKSLEEALELYDRMKPTLKKQWDTLSRMYPIYEQAAKAMGEHPKTLRAFQGDAQALEAELARLAQKQQRAQQCAAIYRALGPAAYMCYAWDEELKALGYSVCTREKIRRMGIDQEPAFVTIQGVQVPVYPWLGDAITQIYEVEPQYKLQLIVHPDGTTTMQVIAESADTEETVEVQQRHCQKVLQLHQRLRDNWFLIYDDLTEREPAEHIYSVSRWQTQDNPWISEEEQTGTAAGDQAKTPPHAMHLE